MLSARSIIALAIIVVVLSGGVLWRCLVSQTPGIPWYAKPRTNEKLTFDQLQTGKYQQLIAKTNEVLPKLKKVCDEHQIKWQSAVVFKPQEGEITYTTYGTPKVELDSKQHHFVFQELTKHLAGYLAWSQSNETEPVIHPDKPRWSNDEVISIGTAFRDAFVGDGQIKFGKPMMKYTPPSGGKTAGSDYHDAEWWIGFPRVTNTGICFGSDGVQIRLRENEGIESITAYLDSDYVEESGTQLSAEQAIDIAKKSRPAMETDSNDIIDYKVKSSDLQIISPNFQSWQPGRLAWVIWLRPVRSNAFVAGRMYDDSQEVVIDALSGKIIAANAIL